MWVVQAPGVCGAVRQHSGRPLRDQPQLSQTPTLALCSPATKPTCLGKRDVVARAERLERDIGEDVERAHRVVKAVDRRQERLGRRGGVVLARRGGGGAALANIEHARQFL